MLYTNGTKCDLTGKPRTAIVKYICEEVRCGLCVFIYALCFQGVNYAIASVTEVETCNYELVVLTNRLCAHPVFQKPRSKDFEIRCYTKPATDISQSVVRPAGYNQFLDDHHFRDFNDVLKKNINVVDDSSTTLLDLSLSIEDDEVDELEDDGPSKRMSPGERVVTLTRLVESWFSGEICLDARTGRGRGVKICYRKSGE